MKNLILFFALTSLMFSCGHQQDNSPIVLDNGQKWTIISSMDVYLQEMEDLVANFKGESLEDHQDLAKELKENIALLTANCTMKGQAHDELHKWLLPYIELVDNYSKVDSKQAAAEHFAKVKNSFEEYNKYFK